MQIIQSGRGSGKTLRMLQALSADEDAVLVTFSEREADRVRRLALEMEILGKEELRRVISCERAREVHLRGERKIYVDNIDLVLAHMFGTNAEIVGGTVTG